METCGGILADRVLQPGVSLESFVLTQADVPAGYVGGAVTSIPAAGESAPTGPRATFYASVPSTVPVAHVTFTVGPADQSAPVAGSTYIAIDEAIGMVRSTPEAAQLASQMRSALESPQCLVSGQTSPLPGAVPGLVAVESSGSSRAGYVASATVVASKGPYVVNVRWSTQKSLAYDQPPSPGEGPPPLPGPSEMAQTVDAALGHLPG